MTRPQLKSDSALDARRVIPPRTRIELASPAPRGQRHEQMKNVVLPLLGAGLMPDAVFTQLRGMYEADVSDGEIRNIIAWALSKNPQPCGCRSKVRNSACDSGILHAIPCLMILICVFLSVPILPTSLAFSDYGISPLLPRFVSNYSRSPSE